MSGHPTGLRDRLQILLSRPAGLNCQVLSQSRLSSKSQNATGLATGGFLFCALVVLRRVPADQHFPECSLDHISGGPMVTNSTRFPAELNPLVDN